VKAMCIPAFSRLLTLIFSNFTINIFTGRRMTTLDRVLELGLLGFALLQVLLLKAHLLKFEDEPLQETYLLADCFFR